MSLSGNKANISSYVFLDILKAFVYLTMLLCDALAFKIVSIPFLGLKTVTASGVIFVLSFAFMNTISNVYGFEHAKRTLYTTLFLQAIFCSVMTFFSGVSVNIPEAPKIATAYYTVFHQSYRVIFSSTIAVFTGFYINSMLLSVYKKYFYNKNYLVVYFIINTISKAWLVLVAYTINFSSILRFDEILVLMYHTWIFKISLGFVVVFTLTPILTSFARRVDHKDVVDLEVSYVPYPFVRNNFGNNFYSRTIK